jgi:hypothetical protein
MSDQRRTRTAAAIFLVAAALGCSGAESDAGATPGAMPDPNTLDAATPNGDPGAGGLPCDVSALLERYCIGCHSAQPVPPVPMPLVRYEDLIAPRGNPPRPVAARALERMQRGSMPPPPSTAPSTAEIAAFASWVQAGTPRALCTDRIDAGPPAPNPYDTPLQCSSNRRWTDGDEESPLMHPGGACIRCHTRDDEGPRFSIGGTVYRTAHEPDDCFGVAGRSENVIVQITDVRGAVIELRVNEAGNFFHEGDLATPYSAKVIANGKERVMPVKQTSGDCNGCHTVTGASGAPGRVMAP